MTNNNNAGAPGAPGVTVLPGAMTLVGKPTSGLATFRTRCGQLLAADSEMVWPLTECCEVCARLSVDPVLDAWCVNCHREQDPAMASSACWAAMGPATPKRMLATLCELNGCCDDECAAEAIRALAPMGAVAERMWA